MHAFVLNIDIHKETNDDKAGDKTARVKQRKKGRKDRNERREQLARKRERKQMAVELPTWLNLSFVEKVLRKSEGDNSIKVIDIVSKPATSKGDNYSSNMVRITVEFSRDEGDHKITEKKSIIAKISISSIQQDLVAKSGYFHLEMSMISDTLDKMNKLLGPKHRLSGKGLYMPNENPLSLILEDLAPLGFRMADRLSGLDLAHTVLALHGLARFHAASVAVCEKEPNLKKMYSKGIFNNEHSKGKSRDFFKMSTKTLADEIANWPEVKKYSEKIGKLADHMYQKGAEAAKPSEHEFNVINHGDCHVNNMLFKYDNNGKPTDHIFVDFQLCVYTSPAIDLLYFLNSSLSLDVMENKTDIVLNEYHDILSATMKQLNCKTQPPTMEELKAILKRRAIYGMLTVFSVLPVLLCSKSEAADLEDLFSDGYVNPGLKNETYKKIMIKRIPLYDEWGLLDV